MIAHQQYALRRIAEKTRRRVRQAIGRADSSPWIFDPPSPRRTAHVDFLFGLSYLSPNSPLMRTMHEAMGERGLSVLLVNKSNVEKVCQSIDSGWLRPHVYLDLCSWPGDEFEKLRDSAAAAGVHTMTHPDHFQWVFKAYNHPILLNHGLPLPPSVIIRKDEPDRELTDGERQLVGEHVVLKPSLGGANKGVVIDVEPTRKNIAAARDFDRDNDWLVQKLIRWTRFGDRPAYLRGYNIGGQRTLLWWCKDRGKDSYGMLSWEDLYRHGLISAVSLVDHVAEITGMDFFSIEIAILHEDPAHPDRYCLIDYVNDQCDVDPAGHPEFSPPEPFARWACSALADLAWRKKHAMNEPAQRGLFLVDA